MRVCASEPERSTYVCPEGTLFQEERYAVPPRLDITASMDENFLNMIVIMPDVRIMETKYEITGGQAMKFNALKEIQEVAGGKLTHWREEEHLGEKSLFETFKRE